MAPGLGRGPFSIFCVLCLLAEPRHLLLRGPPPLRGQRARPPAHRAVAITVHLVMLQRRGQERGQRPRPASGRSGDGLQPGGGLPQRRRRSLDLILGRDGELREAAEPAEPAAAVPRPDAGRGLPRRSQIWGPPAERRQTDSRPLVGRTLEANQHVPQALAYVLER